MVCLWGSSCLTCRFPVGHEGKSAMARNTIDLTTAQAQTLAIMVSRRRMQMGYKSARALGRETGLDYRTITAVESGVKQTVDPNTLLALEVGLNLPANSLRDLVDGSDHFHVSYVMVAIPEEAAEQYSVEIVAAAQEAAQAAFESYLHAHQRLDA
jgi:hypothetical protein